MALATAPSTRSGRRTRHYLAAAPGSESIPVTLRADGGVEATHEALLWASFAYFFAHLTDDAEEPYIIEPHHYEWCELMQHNALLVLMAPRDHGKTVLAIAYIAWRAWRHNRRPDGVYLADLPEGAFRAVIFSETIDQAGLFFEALQALLVGNPILFGEIIPAGAKGLRQASIRDVWSRRRLRLKNLFECTLRAFRTSTRGMHPDLIVLDDVLSDKNSQTAYQRGKVWTYFVGTLMPMNPQQMIVIGTAQHYDDLLHRLRPDPSKPPLIIRNKPTTFVFRRYRAINWDTGAVLWEGRHNRADLEGRRGQDALLFSREYQNEPRDDASSIFPYTLTGVALVQGEGLTFPTTYRAQQDEVIMAGMDIAISAEIGADYTVLWVAAYNRVTQQRRILWGCRERGLSFQNQIGLLRGICTRFGVNMGVVEENGFQKWLFAETQRYPETAGKFVGHRTGREKADLGQGVPSLKIALEQHLWTFPTGDEECRALATIWQAEMSAFGWKDGKLQGAGEHDDTVMAFWFVERAIRLLNEWLADNPPSEEIVHGTDEGFVPVRIGSDW